MHEEHDYAGAQKALEHSLDLNPELAEAHYELTRTLAATSRCYAKFGAAQQKPQ